MAGKIERIMDLVVREKLTSNPRDERLTLSRSMLFGGAMIAAGVLAWQWIGPLAVLPIVMGLAVMRGGAVESSLKLEVVTRKAHVLISDQGIDIAGERFIARREIQQAYYQPRSGVPSTLRCLNASNDLLFEAQVESEDDAEALLEALGQDATHTRSHFRTASPPLNGKAGVVFTITSLTSSLVLAIWLLGSGYVMAAVATLACFVAFAIWLNVLQDVEVGVDGILTRWLGKSEFIPYEDVESVSTEPRRVVLHRRSRAAPVILWAPESRLGVRDGRLEIDALVARVHEARRAHTSGAGARDLAALVGRGNRAIAEWRAELVRMHEPEKHGGYRTLAPRGEDLWQVVEDASAPEDARAGAAVVLRKGTDAGPRLRIAAEAVASPKLRIALERAADPETDEATLDEALEAFAARAPR